MKYNLIKKLKIEEILIILFPFIIITGPALPDISGVILILIFFYNFFRQKKNLVVSYWLIFIILLNIWFIFISFFAYNINLSLTDAIIFSRFILFIIAILYFFENNNKLLKYVLYSVFLATIFVTIDTLFQFYNYSSEHGFQGDIFGIKEQGLYGRLNGPFKDYIPGSYLSRLYFLLFLLIISNNLFFNKVYKLYFFGITLGLVFSTMFFSGEQMSVCTTLMGLFIIYLFYKKYRKYITIIILTALTIIIINKFFHPFYNDYRTINHTAIHEGMIIEKEFKCENSNKVCYKSIRKQPSIITVLKDFKNSAYGEIYITSFKMWKKNKITGVGLNNYETVCKNEIEFKIKDNNLGCVSHPHNYYIQALVESGLIGFILFILFILFFIYRFKNFKNNEYQLIGLIIFLVIFWPIMSTGSFLKNGNMIFICYLLGIVLHLSNIKFCKTNN